MQSYKYILLMKAGPYCGYPLEKIIDIKEKEEKKIGKFFWGYSGVFCRPNILQSFISKAQSEGEKVWVLFSETKSSYTTSTQDRFTKFSKDMDTWLELPKEVLLVGNILKKHFAIAATNLQRKSFEISLDNYCTLSGFLPNTGQTLDRYFKYRVDKVCGYKFSNEEKDGKKVKIQYIAELTEPYSMYIK